MLQVALDLADPAQLVQPHPRGARPGHRQRHEVPVRDDVLHEVAPGESGRELDSRRRRQRRAPGARLRPTAQPDDVALARCQGCRQQFGPGGADTGLLRLQLDAPAQALDGLGQLGVTGRPDGT